MNRNHAFALVAFATLTTAASAQSVFFDGFLADNGARPARDYNGFFLWNVTNGSVNLMGNNLGGPDPVGGRYVNLAGSQGDPGRFATRTPIAFLANQVYVLTFDAASVDGKTNVASIQLGNITKRITVTEKKFNQVRFAFRFQENTSTSLVFFGLEGKAQVGIDNVLIEPLPRSSRAVVTTIPKNVP